MRFVGVDPGVAGGLACLEEDGRVVCVSGMPVTDGDILELLKFMRGDAASITRGALEQVHSSPQMGVVSAFTFGVGFGRVRMALWAAGVSCIEVSPSKWRTAMGCRSAGGEFGRGGSLPKAITKARAQQLFPQVKITHKIADALLIAEYARRLERGL